MRKGCTKLTTRDFEEYPIWELQGSLTTAEPYQGKIPFEADRSRAFFVRTKFILADKTRFTGWTMICIAPYEVFRLSPTILTETGPVGFTKVASQPDQKNIDAVIRRMGKPIEKIFPLRFETDVAVPDGPATGEMTGFLHRLDYEDDNGWPKHVDYFYKTAAELDSAINSFNEKEATRKLTLEPSKEEKAFLKAVKAQDMAKVKLLLSKGVNLNRGGTFNYGGYTRKNVTPLMLAAEAGDLEMLKILLKAGAKIDLADDSNEPRKSGKTALAYAYEKHVKAVRLLLEAGANPNHKFSFGHTQFDGICFDGNTEAIEMLLNFGADPNASCGKSDYFALERAVSSGRLDIVKLLVKCKADVNGRDIGGEAALTKALRLSRQQIVQFLLENGAEAESKAIRK